MKKSVEHTISLPVRCAVRTRFSARDGSPERCACGFETEELQHGRLAMIAIAGFFAQELIDGNIAADIHKLGASKRAHKARAHDAPRHAACDRIYCID